MKRLLFLLVENLTKERDEFAIRYVAYTSIQCYHVPAVCMSVIACGSVLYG